MDDVLEEVIARSRAGEAVAIPSVCSAHPEVIEACLRLARRRGRAVVVEATSNQVNQEGGYTGQRPHEFVAMVHGLADRAGLDRSGLVLGGDHLGPQAWRHLPAEGAMRRAEEMVRAYVAAEFTKIHLDCSEGCAGEPPRLPDEVTVPRARALAEAAGDRGLLFVVGTEVPPPGGARGGEHGVEPTRPEAARRTLDAHVAALGHLGRIGGLVVQPGVEFGALAVDRLPMDRDPGLREAVAHVPGVVLEAHSTDYQHPDAFPRLAALGFAFQKVGPALTFAWREAVYALDALARVAGWGAGEGVPETMERLMLADPAKWERHLDATADLRPQRHFAYADRIRYLWPHPEAREALARLEASLGDLPEPMLRQGFPDPVLDLAETLSSEGLPRPAALRQARVQAALAPYLFDA